MSIQNFFKSVISSSTGRLASGRSRSRSQRPRWSLHSPILEALEARRLLMVQLVFRQAEAEAEAVIQQEAIIQQVGMVELVKLLFLIFY